MKREQVSEAVKPWRFVEPWPEDWTVERRRAYLEFVRDHPRISNEDRAKIEALLAELPAA